MKRIALILIAIIFLLAPLASTPVHADLSGADRELLAAFFAITAAPCANRNCNDDSQCDTGSSTPYCQSGCTGARVCQITLGVCPIFPYPSCWKAQCVENNEANCGSLAEWLEANREAIQRIVDAANGQ